MTKTWLAFGLAIAAAAAAAACPAGAQLRVVVDGRVQDVPDGIVRTISYTPGGRQTIRDEPFRGRAAAGAATITTTETSDEDEQGRLIATRIVTRIEPVVAVAYAPAVDHAIYDPPASYVPPPHLEVDPATFATPDREPSSAPRSLRIRRDPATGHFITTIRINGVEIRAIVDTGAASTILSARDASASGASQAIFSSQRMIGIGGFTMLNVARIGSLEVAGQQLGGFSAAIGQDGLSYTLLGQTEIARLGRIVIEDGTMTITPRAKRFASR